MPSTDSASTISVVRTSTLLMTERLHQQDGCRASTRSVTRLCATRGRRPRAPADVPDNRVSNFITDAGARDGRLTDVGVIPEIEAVTAPIRVLIAKVGLDGHDRGAKIVARCLRDAGMDVVYTGLHRTPEEVVAAAVQEDVDVLGVSLLSGAHMTLIPRLAQLLREADAGDLPLVVGGVIPDEDVPELLRCGARDVLLQDTPPDAIVARIRAIAAGRGTQPG